jgi:hypothetical protein
LRHRSKLNGLGLLSCFEDVGMHSPGTADLDLFRTYSLAEHVFVIPPL